MIFMFECTDQRSYPVVETRVVARIYIEITEKNVDHE